MGDINYLFRYSRKAYGCTCLNGSCERFNPQLCNKDFDDQPRKPKNVFVMSDYRRKVWKQSIREY